MIYGEWKNVIKNIKFFFIVIYFKFDIESIEKVRLNLIVEFIFVGSLVVGKNLLYVIKIID